MSRDGGAGAFVSRAPLGQKADAFCRHRPSPEKVERFCTWDCFVASLLAKTFKRNDIGTI